MQLREQIHASDLIRQARESFNARYGFRSDRLGEALGPCRGPDLLPWPVEARSTANVTRTIVFGGGQVYFMALLKIEKGTRLKAFVDSLGGLWFQGKLKGKAGSAFTSSSTMHGGNESTLR